MRLAIDTGGTFTDLLVESDDGSIRMFKAPTTPADPVQGILDVLARAADGFGLPLREFLESGAQLIYGTTHAVNALITGNAARTAFLTTRGHPDILTLREGGRSEPFNFTVPFPSPLVPRSLTWEIGGRILADGSELEPFDETDALRVIGEMAESGVEAVGVCLLWSAINPSHELHLGALLTEHLPGVPFTLSHQINPTLREYRRASSACIDASLKPMMNAYLSALEERLAEAGFEGRVLVVTSQGGVMDARDVARTPINLLNSGPSMAPISGRYYARHDLGADNAIIADTGGTTYDVSLVRHGVVPSTRETWIGQPYRGHMTGFPSVDVKSVGAGGGSIAWVDDGGMLHVGPQSAGSVPGPVCYAAGGTRPTVTDAAVSLGYIDPDFFLGGSIRLDAAGARRAIEEHVAGPLGISSTEAGLAIIQIATENMVQAILDITVNQGIDPRQAVLVGGGGAAGLNSVLIARRLGSRKLLIPEVGAMLSAAGAMISDLTTTHHAHCFTTWRAFDRAAVNATLAGLQAKAGDFLADRGKTDRGHDVRFKVEARYAEQVWDIEVPVAVSRFENQSDIDRLADEFHRVHEQIFAVSDRKADIEFINWSVAVAVRVRDDIVPKIGEDKSGRGDGSRLAEFPGEGRRETAVRRLELLPVGVAVPGPAIIESSYTSVVINPGATAVRLESGSLAIDPTGN
ncbi:MAG: hydantoinase/oxoprolinase family protein [Bauldia sp.]|nr:hydantoinase/oxoprolinase family protein [Bauldia sp.]